MWRTGQAYSQDLRERVLRAIDQGGRANQVAELFKVSVSYIDKALARRAVSGETTARPQRSRQDFKLTALHATIAAEVERRPDATLAELRHWLKDTHGAEVSLGTMHNTLVRLGLTLKKSRVERKSRIGPISPDGASSGGDCSAG
jgi:transposase